MNQSELEANTCYRRQARENACDKNTDGFGCTSDWLRKWSEFYKPITERIKANPKQTRITFDNPLKTAPKKAASNPSNLLQSLSKRDWHRVSK